jgi:hypothetical protein
MLQKVLKVATLFIAFGAIACATAYATRDSVPPTPPGAPRAVLDADAAASTPVVPSQDFMPATKAPPPQRFMPATKAPPAMQQQQQQQQQQR